MMKATPLAAALALVSGTAMAQNDFSALFEALIPDEGSYEVTITNLTPSQTFTPQLLVTHSPAIALFAVGDPALPELEILAEGGNTTPLQDLAGSLGATGYTIDGLLGPGETISGEIDGLEGDVISVAAMLIPTNDTFMALNSAPLPVEGSVTYYVQAYDAGTEENDQLCRNIPGPTCGGEGVSEEADGDEGFVHISNGFHNLRGNALKPEDYDWRNPVARVTVTAL